jgi:pyruvate-formate lyase-activating enzyme
MNLAWIIENRTVPVEVTASLQALADRHHYTVDVMHQRKQEIVRELQQMGKGFIVRYLFPNGIEDEERWLHALIRMEIRKMTTEG